MGGIEGATVRVGKRGLQYIAPALETDLLLASYAPLSFQPIGELSPLSTDEFSDTTLVPGEVMIIMSSQDPVAVEKVTGKERSVLFIGQMSTEAIGQIARLLELSFTSTGPGIYWCSLRLDDGK